MDLYEWAAKWRVPLPALHELQQQMGLRPMAADPVAQPGRSESNVQSRIRLEAARKNMHLWRNNVGATPAKCGHCGEALQPVRYGLANDSAKLNRVIKSSDLIGIRPVKILPVHVGQVIGQFVAREVKAEGWTFSGTEREMAQQRFIELVAANGGDAAFTDREGTL